MRYPEFLKENGNIGFIAPSFGCSTEPYASLFIEALANFRKMGFKLTEGPNTRKGDGIGKSTSSEACADEINDFFINKRSDVIISCGGGELMCEDLSFVDFDKIAKAIPSWFMGYSDNTNLTFLLPTLCDTAAIYGPCASTFGMKPWHESLDDAFKLLKGEKLTMSNYDGWELEDMPEDAPVTSPFNITEMYKQVIFNGSKASFNGRIIGGCMDCLEILIGTRFDKVKDFCEKYKDDGIIWFLECCDLNVMSMRRTLWHMEEAGWFKYVKGFLIGRPLNFYDTFGDFDHYEAVTGILSKYKVPIIMDLDIGHLHPQFPIISGSIASVNAAENAFNIEYKLK